MSIYIPAIHARGRFRLSGALANLLSESVEYTCTGLRTLADLAGSGVDVVAEYYTPIGLDQAAYDSDVAAGALMVTLQAGVAPPVTVPSTYFTSSAEIGGVKYFGRMIALNLASLPADMSLAPLQQRLVEVVKQTIGVEAASRSIVTDNGTVMSEDQHTIIEATRAQNITQVNTDYALFLAERTRADTLQQRVTALSKYIEDNLAPPAAP